MALSNLIWWPWFQIGSEAPAQAETLLAGDRRVFNEVIRRHPPSEDEDDEEILMAWILSKL